MLILSTNLTSFKRVHAEVRMFSHPLFLSKAIWTALIQMRRKKFLKLFDCLEPGILWSHKETLLLIYRPEGRLSWSRMIPHFLKSTLTQDYEWEVQLFAFPRGLCKHGWWKNTGTGEGHSLKCPFPLVQRHEPHVKKTLIFAIFYHSMEKKVDYLKNKHVLFFCFLGPHPWHMNFPG